MRLFILISLSFLGITRSSKCIYQMRTRTVQRGGSVTIPCSYPGLEELGEDKQIIWGETDIYCSSNTKIILPSGKVVDKYNGRLYREKDPNRNWMEYITITGLEPTDGPRFCCQLYDSKQRTTIKWSTHGTLLQFSYTEYVTQLDELMAVTGEEVIIPCYYSKDTEKIAYVSWNFADGENDRCSDTLILQSNGEHQVGRYSLVNFTKEISLHIHKIHLNDHRSYCCTVSTAQNSMRSKQFTRLIVADYQLSWDETTKKISVQEGHSMNLTCSYNLPDDKYTERNVVRVNVYWRVGNVTGPYAYHPYQEMVHSTYRHRTSITGMTNLIINDVKKADNTSFHCFVVIKLCEGDNQYEDSIQYGGATRLIINDASTIEEHRTNGGNGPEEKKSLMIIIVSAVAFLIILIVILIILKIKGVICKKKKHFSELQMNTIPAGDLTFEEAPYCEIGTKKPEDIPMDGTDEAGSNEMKNGQMEDGEDGNLLYAKINQTKLKEKHPAENTKQNEEVVYAAVVKTTSE